MKTCKYEFQVMFGEFFNTVKYSYLHEIELGKKALDLL